MGKEPGEWYEIRWSTGFSAQVQSKKYKNNKSNYQNWAAMWEFSQNEWAENSIPREDEEEG